MKVGKADKTSFMEGLAEEAEEAVRKQDLTISPISIGSQKNTQRWIENQ